MCEKKKILERKKERCTEKDTETTKIDAATIESNALIKD